MYENSNYQVYLEQMIKFNNAIWERHLKRLQDGIGQEIILPGTECVAAIEKQNWDSDVMGFSAGRVTDVFHAQPLSRNEAECLVALIEKEIQASNLSFISIRISVTEISLLQALEDCGWCAVDRLNIYYACLNSLRASKIKALPEQYVLGDFDLTEGLSFLEREHGLFYLSRMHMDTNISKVKADNFYKEVFCSQYQSPTNFRVGLWMKDQLIAIAIGNRDQWLADTLNFNLGYLWLIGISEAMQGKFLSKPLLAAFLVKAKEQLENIEIGTQAGNIAANKLYLSLGFKLVARAVTLHRWN